MLSAQFLKHENPLVVCPIDADLWIIHVLLNSSAGAMDENIESEAPEYFVTDFASIPRILWAIAPRWVHGWAAVIHDFLYWDQRMTRQEADDVFLDAMIDSAVPAWRRMIIYRAVRQFEWLAWKRNEALRACNPCARFRERPLPDPFNNKKWRDGYLEETT